MDHVAPGCVSNERFKGIVYDQSVGVFNGKVFVRREAQQTNAYQQSQGVVLEPGRQALLEARAGDLRRRREVLARLHDRAPSTPRRCSTSARAASRRARRASLLLYAFAHDVVEMVASEPLRDHLDARIAERLT